MFILEAAYKKDIDDMRESLALKLNEIFREQGADVDYYDLLVPILPKTRKYKFDMKSIKLTKEKLSS